MENFRNKKLRLPKLKNIYNAFSHLINRPEFEVHRAGDGKCLTFIFDWVTPLSTWDNFEFDPPIDCKHVVDVEVPNIILGQEKNTTYKDRVSSYPARNCDLIDLPDRPVSHPNDEIHAGLGVRDIDESDRNKHAKAKGEKNEKKGDKSPEQEDPEVPDDVTPKKKGHSPWPEGFGAAVSNAETHN